MSFYSFLSVQSRLLKDPSRLTEQDIRDLIPWIRDFDSHMAQRLHVELSLQNIEAIQKFDRSSSKLSSRIGWLTFVILFLTFVIAGFTIALYIQGARNTTLLERFEKESIPVKVVAEPVDEKAVIPKQEVMEESENPEEEAKDKNQASPTEENPKSVD